MIRPCIIADLPWMLEVAHKTFPEFDPVGGVEAFKRLIGTDQVFIVRGEHGWILAFFEKTPWQKYASTFVELVALDKSRQSIIEMLDIIKYVKKLGEEKGATKMRLAALDVVGNLGCFVKRLNGREIGKLWEI
ncbi:MAG: hypothetical protein KGL39_36960 [Patescibacteria group bacterium]|nr:hypothetical protein [Patescibacteria group bacterium]